MVLLPKIILISPDFPDDPLFQMFPSRMNINKDRTRNENGKTDSTENLYEWCQPKNEYNKF